MEFSDRLIGAIREKRSCLIVGLDPHLELLPPSLTTGIDLSCRAAVARVVNDFCLGILDSVHDIAAAVKPQVAFFERLGPTGYDVLERVVAKARERGLIVISDAKRGDIGSTATAYADYHLGPAAKSQTGTVGLGADAITISPYLGSDSLAPFATYLARGRGIFILAKTSNLGSADFQDRLVEQNKESVPLYYAVAELAQTLADRYPIGHFGYSSVGLVVGATFPKQGADLRQAFSRLIFLVPGVGAQGAKPSDITGCFNSDGLGAVVNASRSILFAYRDDPDKSDGLWRETARAAAIKLRDELNTAISSR
jgi:orotidine-5'-phosphate decarboxylase